MTIVTVGIDLAKNVFAVHGIDVDGTPKLVRSAVKRADLAPLVASLSPCTIGMEACSGAHHWARLFSGYGHTVKLIAAKFVTPYRMTGRRSKNDAADAAAICEALQRPNMRFVPVKTVDQQQQLTLHRVRQGFVQARTANMNRLRGLLSEFGIVMPLQARTIKLETREHLDELPAMVRDTIQDLLAEIRHLDERVSHYDKLLRRLASVRDTPANRLTQLPGVGETTATAIVATIGNGHEFKNGRQFAAWLGLVPSQYSSGGKARLGRITKAGDSYLRTLLVLGARATLAHAGRRKDSISQWALQLQNRRGYWKAVVAVAAKIARMAWAVLTRGDQFKLPV
ncbi:MAG: IS110 family transposase [Burkholderiaceae bacterium]